MTTVAQVRRRPAGERRRRQLVRPTVTLANSTRQSLRDLTAKDHGDLRDDHAGILMVKSIEASIFSSRNLCEGEKNSRTQNLILSMRILATRTTWRRGVPWPRSPMRCRPWPVRSEGNRRRFLVRSRRALVGTLVHRRGKSERQRREDGRAPSHRTGLHRRSPWVMYCDQR